MVHISESAARQLRSMIEERSLEPDKGLRLFVERGGCAGLQYGMEISGRAPSDHLFERDGARVFVDDESFDLLTGSTLDYVDDLAGAGFRIVNPNAARSCGCGTSFEPAPDS
jgi:iron-sulfur cluster assembly accessory protein